MYTIYSVKRLLERYKAEIIKFSFKMITCGTTYTRIQ